MNKKELYELGMQAKKGNEYAMLEVIEEKKNLIKKYSHNNEDQSQYITLKLIEAVKRYKKL